VGDIMIGAYDPLKVWCSAQRSSEDSIMFVPEVGDAVRMKCGGLGYVVGVSDLCFAVALSDVSMVVEEGDPIEFLPKSARPTIVLPETGGVVVDLAGNVLWDGSEEPRAADESREKLFLFNEMVPLIQRQRINAPLHAGVMALDCFVPIGRGQSMLMRMPSNAKAEHLREFIAHIVEAQECGDVWSVVPVSTPELGRPLVEAVREGSPSAAERLVVVAALSGRVGENVLVKNAAMSLAENIRDRGGNSLVLLDMEPMYQAWSSLTE
jgi:F0F1-type ATP synthase alpha subunit